MELRLEVAKLVMQLPDTTIDNFHERAYRIGLYLQGDAELPEHVDELGTLKVYLEEQIKHWERQNQEHQRWMETMRLNSCVHPSTDPTALQMFTDPTYGASAQKYKGKPEECFSPNGIPSSEGESMFLQEDDEKVE